MESRLSDHHGDGLERSERKLVEFDRVRVREEREEKVESLGGRGHKRLLEEKSVRVDVQELDGVVQEEELLVQRDVVDRLCELGRGDVQTYLCYFILGMQCGRIVVHYEAEAFLEVNQGLRVNDGRVNNHLSQNRLQALVRDYVWIQCLMMSTLLQSIRCSSYYKWVLVCSQALHK